MGRNQRLTVALGLIFAVVAGAVAGMFDSVDVQSVLFAVSSIGWVTVTSVLAVRHAVKSEHVVAAGFLVLTIAEPLLWVSGRSGDPGYEAGFAGGAMFYVPGFLLLAVPAVYHMVVRAFAAAAAVAWAVGSITFLTGGSFEHTDTLALVGYSLLSVAFVGVALAVWRQSPPHSVGESPGT